MKEWSVGRGAAGASIRPDGGRPLAGAGGRPASGAARWRGGALLTVGGGVHNVRHRFGARSSVGRASDF